MRDETAYSCGKIQHYFCPILVLISTTKFNPSPLVQDGQLVFPAPTDPLNDSTESVSIALFDESQDPDGVASRIPHMEHFYDNSLQTGLMRDLAIDLEVLGEHLVLLGNQVSILS